MEMRTTQVRVIETENIREIYYLIVKKKSKIIIKTILKLVELLNKIIYLKKKKHTQSDG